MSLKDLTKTRSLLDNPICYPEYKLWSFGALAERLGLISKCFDISTATLTIPGNPTFGSLLDLQKAIYAVDDELDGIAQLRDYVNSEIALIRHRFSDGHDLSGFISCFLTYTWALWMVGCNTSNLYYSIIGIIFFTACKSIGRVIVERIAKSYKPLEDRIMYNETFLNDFLVNLAFLAPIYIILGVIC